MQPEIGSNFWITPEDLETESAELDSSAFGCRGSDSVWLSTGRSAIAFTLEEARRRDPDMGCTALLSPYTCHTVIKPFLKAGYTVKTYPVDEHLQTDGGTLLQAAEESGASVVLVHRYFGFDTLPGAGETVAVLRDRGVVTIEDRTQCIYSGLGPLAVDYTIGSIRKWSGVPDGAFAVCREGTFSRRPEGPDLALAEAKTAAGVAKYRCLFQHTGDKPAFLALFREAEELLDRQKGFRAMGDLSLRMQTALDIETLRRKRRENYQTLLGGLEGCPGVQPLFSELPKDAVPLYFPLWVENDRAALQTWLRDASIYAPVVWPRPENLPPVCRWAEAFYQHLLCLPIDQRYDADDMERTAEWIWRMERERDSL